MDDDQRHDGIPAEHLPDCVWRTDLDLRLLYASTAALSMFGIPADALIGSPLADHTTDRDGARLRELLRQALALPDRTTALVHETHIRHADGRLIPVEVHSRLLLDGDGRPVEVLGVARDISSRRARERRDRQREQQRLEDQKLDALGHLAGGVVDVIEPLLAAMADGGEELAAYRRDAARFVDRLRTMAGRQPLQPRDLDIDGLLTEILGVLRAEQPPGIELIHQPGASGATVRADSRLVELAVTELVRHACWSVRDGGLVTVLTGLRPADAPADGPPTAPAPPWVTVEVRDTGPGLDHAARERVLEPFLPGRPDAAPLGLAMVRGIVAQHHGHLEVASRPGDGMAIRMVIPARFADPWQPADVAPDSSRPRTILLVDDDPEVRSYCQRILQSGGYAVTSCADGAEALAVIAGGEAVDAVVLDWALPGLDGRRVREQILRRQPRLPLLVISGHASKDYEALGGIDGDTPWLAKPFTPPALLDAVARLLPAEAEAPGS